MSPVSIDKIKKSIATVAPYYGVKRVTLFGSYANGTQTADSDIDLLVEFADLSDVCLFTLIRLKDSLQVKTGKNVDIIPFPVEKGSLLIIDKEVEVYSG